MFSLLRRSRVSAKEDWVPFIMPSSLRFLARGSSLSMVRLLARKCAVSRVSRHRASAGRVPLKRDAFFLTRCHLHRDSEISGCCKLLREVVQARCLLDRDTRRVDKQTRDRGFI